MKTFLFCIVMILALVLAFFLLTLLGVFYEWMRRKINKPQIGFENFNAKIIKRGDYVSINGKVMCFSHITECGEIIDPIRPPMEDNKLLGGELAFQKNLGLGYEFYSISSLRQCDFIYGKYGVKWAASNHWASIAKDKVEDLIWNMEPTENQERKDYYSIVRDVDLRNSKKDKNGVVYSIDGQKVLEFKDKLFHKVKNIQIRQNVEIICDAAFLRKKIEEIELPYSLKCIGLEAFFKSELRSINLQNNIRIIKDGAFAFCTSLVSVEVPNSIQTISAHLFEGCSNLEKIYLPKKLSSIGAYAFSGCSNLKHILLPNQVEIIGMSAFEGCKSLVFIELPENLSIIGNYAFSFCSSLGILSLANVQRIEQEAFSFCNSLKYVEITESVDYIGSHAFLGCESLRTVCFNSQDIYVCDDIFERCNNLACLFIPKGSKSKFEEMLPKYSIILFEK